MIGLLRRNERCMSYMCNWTDTKGVWCAVRSPRGRCHGAQRGLFKRNTEGINKGKVLRNVGN